MFKQVTSIEFEKIEQLRPTQKILYQSLMLASTDTVGMDPVSMKEFPVHYETETKPPIETLVKVMCYPQTIINIVSWHKPQKAEVDAFHLELKLNSMRKIWGSQNADQTCSDAMDESSKELSGYYSGISRK